MNKIPYLIVYFLLVSGCSLDTKTGLWTETVKLKPENKTIEKALFEKEEVFEILISTAKSEAKIYYGNDEVYIE